jgi:small-conductance mechanosensitive channel
VNPVTDSAFWSRLTDSIHKTIGVGVNVQAKILVSLLIIFALWIVRLIVARVLIRRVQAPRDAYVWRKWTTNIAVLLGVLMVGRVWFEAFSSLATFVGLLTAGLAIALKDLLVNFAGWIFIVWRRPFEVGDRLQIGGDAGDVVDLRIFQFTMLEIGNWVNSDQPTGRLVHIPNGKVFTEPQFNYTKGFNYLWNELGVLVTFESNWNKAKKLLEEIAERHASRVSETARVAFQDAARRYLISISDLSPKVFVRVPDSGVLLTVRYLCEAHRRRITESEIWEEILTEFARCDDIDFAYPTTRFYDNITEGKEGARAAPASPTPSHADSGEGTPRS